MHRLRSTPGRGFRPRSKRFLPIAVALALKTDAHAADVDDRKPVWSGKIPGNSGGLRALYAAGATATAIIAVNGPMAALFLSGAARRAAAPSCRACVVTKRVGVGALVTEYFPMVAAERQGP